ncbi:MAG: alpha/beta fold hydrolase [Steroidobacteraceae bacterium]
MWIRSLEALGILLVALGAGFVVLLYAAPATLFQWIVRLWRRHVGLQRREVVLADGLRIVYLEGGSGEPLLLLHGFGANKDNFLAIAPYLTRHYRLIIPDITGFGESSKPLPADYSPEMQADRLQALLTALGIGQRVHVGGNSMGGLITLYFGARHAGRTASLWLLDPAAMFKGPLSETMTIAVHEKRNPFDIRTVDDLEQLMHKVFVKPPPMPRPFLAVQLQESLANRAVEEEVFRATMRADVEPVIDGMAVPTLIVWGEQDQLVHPGGAPLLQALLANSQLRLMPGIGHVPQVEAPRQAAADYLAFHASLSRSSPVVRP